MTSSAVRNEFPADPGTPVAPDVPRWRGLVTPATFMAPALILLTIWVVYPAIATMIRSLYNDASEYHSEAMAMAKEQAKEAKKNGDAYGSAALEFAVAYHKAALSWLKTAPAN